MNQLPVRFHPHSLPPETMPGIFRNQNPRLQIYKTSKKRPYLTPRLKPYLNPASVPQRNSERFSILIPKDKYAGLSQAAID